MKELRQHLQKLQTVARSQHHPLIHRLHKEYRISRKTLFYIKEYGPHTHVAKTIIRESLKILLFASLLSSFGGLAIEHIKTLFVSFVPLTILLPTLNDMVGDYGTILSAKFSTMLHENLITKKWWRVPELRILLVQILVISLATAIFSTVIALIISSVANYPLTGVIVMKIFVVVTSDTLILVPLLALISVLAGLHFYKKGKDPNNFLIPITTSIADFGNMLILTLLVILIF